MDFNIGNFIIGMAFGPAAVLICPFIVVPWLVVLHLRVRVSGTSDRVAVIE